MTLHTVHQAIDKSVASARIAESTLLQSAALLGVHDTDTDTDTDAVLLVEKVLTKPRKLAERLPPEQREAYLSRFVARANLATACRHDSERKSFK